MNIEEGLLRIAKVIKVGGIFLSIVLFFALNHADNFGEAILAASILYAISFGISWIIEGFVKDR